MAEQHPAMKQPDVKNEVDGKPVGKKNNEFMEFLKNHKAAVAGAIIGIVTVVAVIYFSNKNAAQPSAGTSGVTGTGNPLDTGGLTGGTLGGGTYGDGGTTGTTGTTGGTGTTGTTGGDTGMTGGGTTASALPPQISNLPSNLQQTWQSFSTPTDQPSAWTSQPVNTGGNARREYQGCVGNCESTSVHCKGKGKKGSSGCRSWCDAKCAARHPSGVSNNQAAFSPIRSYLPLTTSAVPGTDLSHAGIGGWNADQMHHQNMQVVSLMHQAPVPTVVRSSPPPYHWGIPRAEGQYDSAYASYQGIAADGYVAPTRPGMLPGSGFNSPIGTGGSSIPGRFIPQELRYGL